MASNHYIPGAVPPSLDDTADYPPLPESAAVPGAPPPSPWPSPAAAPTPTPSHATDTWVMPKLADMPAAESASPAPVQPTPQALAPQPSLDDLLRPYLEEREGLRAELAEARRDLDDLRSELERREAEWRAEAERLEATRAERAQLAERLAEAERAEATRAEVALAEAQRAEAQRADAQRTDSEAAALRTRLEAAQAEHTTLRTQFEAAQTEHVSLRAQLEAAQAELARLAGERERQAAAQSELERERARREATFARSQEELSELHRRVAAHAEALRRVEGQRHVFDAQLREREAMLDAALARAEQAERRLARSPEPVPPPAPPEPAVSVAPAPAPEPIVDPALAVRVEELEAELAASRVQAEALQRQLVDAQQSAQAQRAEPDHRVTLAPADAAPPWPLADGREASEADDLRHARTIATGSPEPLVAPVLSAAPAPVPAALDPGSAEMGTQLLVRTSGAAGIVHVLGRRTTIGRTPDNDLRIEADYVSRHHAVVLVNPERTVIEDLNSTNGVYVNGARVTRHELLEGDVLSIGDTSFRFVRKPASA